MGLLDFLKKKPEAAPQKKGLVYAPSMSGNTPFYSSFGDNIYASEIVVQSIRCKANEFKKLKPRHIRTTNGQQTIITDDSIARVLNRPNEYMTTADLLEKITIMLELNKNVFIYPTYYLNKDGVKVFTGLYPLKPSGVDYLIDAGGRYFIHFQFATGYEVTVPAEDIIHWRKDYYDDYFGGNNSFLDNRGLLRAIKEYDKITQSIAKAIECSCQINGIIKVNSYLDEEAIDLERENFEARIKKSDSGFLVTDLKGDVASVTRDVKLVDAETMEFMYGNILRANGTSLAILNGDYTKAQKEAYYEHALEADIISLGQAFSKCIFSDRMASFGNEIVFYPAAIVFMSMSEKISALQATLPAGILMVNEARELLGYPPVPGGDVFPRGYNNVDDLNNTGNNEV